MKSKEPGFSLLEFLICLGLASFLASGLLNIFIYCKKINARVQHINAIQENARTAFLWLGRDVRMAGFIGCMRLHDFSPLHTQLQAETSLVVWHEGAMSAKLNLPVLSKARADSDIILIQSMAPHTIPVKSAKENKIILLGRALFHPGDKLLISNCQHAEAFRWGQMHLRQGYQEGEVGFLQKIIYYVGNTGRLTPKGKAIYALYRRDFNKSINNPIELVTGIAKMSVRLGIADESARSLQYLTADQIKNWSKVRNLEINLAFDEQANFPVYWKHIIALRERG
jgi:type IV pilus assembly protein PilW